MKGYLWKGFLFGLAHAENGEHDDDTLDEIKRFKIESCNAADKELPENSSILWGFPVNPRIARLAFSSLNSPLSETESNP